MTIKEFLSKAIDIGIEMDPRGPEVPKQELELVRKEYESLSEKEKAFFDTELLYNPYPDSRITWGNADVEIDTSIVCGIEIFGAELVAIDRLGWKPNLVISHHPEGKGSPSLWRVLDMQIGMFKKFGVQVEAFSDLASESSVKRLYEHAERYIREEMSSEVTEAIPRLAELFNLPLISLHTITDNCVSTYLQRLFDEKKPSRIEDIIALLLEIPEYQRAVTQLVGPRVVSGTPKHRSGKILVDMTGGMEGPAEIIPSLAKAGINTIVGMHASSEWYVVAEQHQINMVIAGHAASDSLGMNLLLDKILPSDIKVYELSGFTRIKRN